MKSLEDHPFSVACKCARVLYRELPALRAARAERLLAEFYKAAQNEPKPAETKPADYSRPWTRKRLLGADEKAEAMLSRFNGHPIRLKEFERTVADRAVFQRIFRAGLIEKVGYGLYQRKQPAAPAATQISNTQ